MLKYVILAHLINQNYSKVMYLGRPGKVRRSWKTPVTKVIMGKTIKPRVGEVWLRLFFGGFQRYFRERGNKTWKTVDLYQVYGMRLEKTPVKWLETEKLWNDAKRVSSDVQSMPNSLSTMFFSLLWFKNLWISLLSVP